MSEKEQAVLADADVSLENDSNDEGDIRVYEIGVHIIPSVGEEGVAAEFEAVRSHIKTLKGSIIAEEQPVFMTLAYSMQRDIDRKRHTYDNAFFGWVKFEGTPEAAEDMKKFLLGQKHVLRSLIIKTTRDTFVRFSQPSTSRRESPEAPAEAAPVATAEEAPKEKPMSVEQIDAEIEKLVV